MVIEPGIVDWPPVVTPRPVEHSGLVAFGVSMCGDQDVARSLAQDTMILAYENRDDVLTHPAPLAWLRRVMHNMTVDHLRRTGAEHPGFRS